MKNFSLVSTVFNEASRLQVSLDDLYNQTIMPQEIIIVDAGSKDGTVDIINSHPLCQKTNVKVIIDKGCNVARGRNIAIENASCDLIVSTDFGCRYNEHWLEYLVENFDTHPKIRCSCGSFSVLIDENSSWAAKSDYIIQNGYPIIKGDAYSASSRSIAYYKSVWQEIGGYHEWLTLAADDTIFFRELKEKNIPYFVDERITVFWNRHKYVKQFAKEAGRYGLGDGEGNINFRQFISNTIETACRWAIIPFLIVFLFLPAELKSKTWWIFIILAFGLRSYLRTIKSYFRVKDKIPVKYLFFTPVLIESQRWYYIKNYIKGRFFKSKVQEEESKKITVK